MPDSARRFVFHVGAVPTASWVTQQCLERYAKIWRERGIYCLPNEVLASDIGSGDQLTDDPTRLSDVLRAAFDHSDIAVVAGSREVLGAPFGGPAGAGLHADATPAIEALDKATTGVGRTIVLSVCPPDRLIELHFGRAIAAGGSDSLAEWLGRVDLDNLSWLPLHNTLCAVFGGEAIEVIEFQPTDVGHVRWLEEFFALAGVDVPDAIAARAPSAAVALSEKGLRLAVAANSHLASHRERATLLRFLQRHFSEFDGPAPQFMPPSTRAAARERYDTELDQMAAAAEVGKG